MQPRTHPDHPGGIHRHTAHPAHGPDQTRSTTHQHATAPPCSTKARPASLAGQAFLLSLMLMLLPLGSLAEDTADAHLRLIEAANTLTDRMLAACGDEHYVQIFTSAVQLTDEIKNALAFD